MKNFQQFFTETTKTQIVSVDDKPTINWSLKITDGNEPIGLMPIQLETGPHDSSIPPILMKVDQFLSLNPTRTQKISPNLEQLIKNGNPIAPPVLFVEPHPNNNPNEYIVHSHEGRGRAIIAKQMGIDKIPVQINFKYEKNKNSPKKRNIIIYPDETVSQTKPITVTVINKGSQL
jgi:hypothetical protein